MPPAKKARASRGGTRAPAARPGSRTSRAERLRREKERRALRRRLAIAAVLVVALGALYLYARTRGDVSVVAELEASGRCEYDTVVDGDPPAGGDVASVEAAEPGFYEQGDDPPDDRALARSMRQGFVVLWYQDAADEEAYAVASSLSERFGRDLIVVPRPELPERLAVTSWERRLRCGDPDEAALARFVETFRDKGPEKGFL